MAFPKNQKGRRKTPSILYRVRQLAALEQTEHNKEELQRIDRTLLAWAAYLLEINPSFRANLFRATSDEWAMHVRGVLYEEGSFDERDRACVTFNSQVLFGANNATRESYPADWQPRVDADREQVDAYCAILSQRLTGEQTVVAASEDRQPNVIDLSCWRQSRARTLKSKMSVESVP
jgi:hypothetical protein